MTYSQDPHATEQPPTGGRAPDAVAVPAVRVRGVTACRLPVITFDGTFGNLVWGQATEHVPFEPKRFFLLSNVGAGGVRGQHAHRSLHQFLVCVRGSCAVVFDDGAQRDTLLLDRAAVGIHVRPMVWVTIHSFSPDAVLLVLASDRYDPEDYVRDYDEFVRAKGIRA
jgi:hypothetical protein